MTFIVPFSRKTYLIAVSPTFAWQDAIQASLLARPYILSTALVFCFLVAYAFTYSDRNSPKPPLVPYLLPWIGSTLDMSKDPDAFFERATSKFGHIFRVKTLGKNITYVTSPEAISAVYRDSKTFEFAPLRMEMSEKAFGMSHAASYSPVMPDVVFPIHHRALSPKGVVSLLEPYTKYVFEDIMRAINQYDGTCTPLKPFLIPPAYVSAAHTFLGRSFPAEKSYEPFQRFDSQFPLIAAGLPRFMLPGPHRAWDEVGLMLEKHLQNSHDDMAEVLVELIVALRDAGWSELDIAKTIATDLWAFEANAMWAGYWLIALQLQKPQGLAPLIAEVDQSREEWKRDHPSQSLDTNHYEWMSNAPLPRLISAIHESLRLSTSVFPIRRVSQPTVFEGYRFEEGERVACVTRSVHLDEDIHDKAKEFVPDRYMDSQKKFVKNGKVVPNHSMPFGGGVSMCEGRHFALGEIKTFVALMLTYATIELASESSARPKHDKQRIGTGLMHPVGDMEVHIRKRNVA